MQVFVPTRDYRCMAKYARTTAKPDTQFVYEQSTRNQREFARDAAYNRMARSTANVPLFARGYLVMWAVFAAIAMPAAWWVGKYAPTSWLLPGTPEFAISLALISGVFGRRHANTEAMTVSFLAIFAFGSGLERGIFGLTGLAVALLGGLLLAVLVGAGVWAYINATGVQSGLIDPNDPESMPPTLPIAWQSLLTRWASREHKLRRALFVIGPMLGVGIVLNAFTLLGHSLLGAETLQSDALNVIMRVLCGLVTGGLLGWLLQQFIPELRPKVR
jgi:hypothetical protein